MKRNGIELSNEEASSLANNIRTLLNEKNLKETEFAELAGISRPTVYRIMEGKKRTVTRGILIKIANVFGVTINLLLHTPELPLMTTPQKVDFVNRLEPVAPKITKAEDLLALVQLLEEDPYVKLAREEEAVSDKLRAKIAELKSLQSRGQKLREAGVTREAIRRALGGDED